MKGFFIWMALGVILLASMSGCLQTQVSSPNVDPDLARSEIVIEETDVSPVDSPKARLYLEKYPLPLDKLEDDVVLVSTTSEAVYEYDVSYPSIVEHCDRVALCKVLSLDEVYLGKGWPVPSTSYIVQVEEEVFGDASQDTFKISTEGGFVTVGTYCEQHDESVVNKLGLDKISADDKETKLLALFPGTYQTIIPGKSYVFFLKKASDQGKLSNRDDYYVIGDGYGVFSYDAESGSYRNELNERGFTLEEIRTTTH